jgi:hypothetical protein
MYDCTGFSYGRPCSFVFVFVFLTYGHKYICYKKKKDIRATVLQLTVTLATKEVVWIMKHSKDPEEYIQSRSLFSCNVIRNLNTLWKSSTCRKSLSSFITWCCMEYTLLSAVFEPTTLGTDCTCSCKSNYRTITTWNFKFWPPVDSDGYFGMDGLCQIKCR